MDVGLLGKAKPVPEDGKPISGLKVLVTGGAGYIGTHTVDALLEEGCRVVVYDDLSRGNPQSVPGVPFVLGRVEDERAVGDAMLRGKFDAVVHLAGESLVGESLKDPGKYYRRNVVGGLSVLSGMVKFGVKKMVFSSSAAVYGVPRETPVTEKSPLKPVSPYGESKVAMERALAWFDVAYGLKSISLRYFNAAGAHPSGKMGEQHEPETHLIPLVIKAAVTGEPVTIFGDDYPTQDGTCIRDYVHVTDLAAAHVAALKALHRGCPSQALNLGAGRGYSNLEIVEAVSKCAGVQVPYLMGPRRTGDPPVLVASNSLAREALGWQPLHSCLDEIVGTAWRWHTGHNAE